MLKPASFWDERFSADDYVYGVQPNDFVRDAAAAWLSSPQEVLDLGGGEGRNAVYLAQQGHTVTAVDYSAEGLRKTEQLAEKQGVSVETLRADVREWRPARTWDAVVVTFLHLPPSGRVQLYTLLQGALRPGGILIAEWFRPEQRIEGYTSRLLRIDPSSHCQPKPDNQFVHFTELDGNIYPTEITSTNKSPG